MNIKQLKTTTLTMAFLGLLPLSAVHAQSGLSAEEAHAIGIDAYTYFYPLLIHGCLPQTVHQH